jgi:serine/threonine protein kinase
MTDGIHWEPTEGDTVAGPDSEYELLEHIETGGFTAVFRAREVDSERIVGLKYPNYSSPNPHFDEFVEREVKALRTIRCLGGHPNVMTLREHFVEQGTDFLVVEFIEGDVIKNRSSEGDPQHVRRIGLKICEALAIFHWNDLVYRDVKDDNIMLTQENKPVLIDLNAVRTLPTCPSCREPVRHVHANDSQCPACNSDMGPVTRISNANRGHYRAPEQSDSAIAPGPWTDIYGLGKLLFLLLTGFTPMGDNVDPRNHVDCPEYLAQIVQRATDSDPAQRYASAAEMGRALYAQNAKPTDPIATLTDIESGEQYEIQSGASIGRAQEGSAPTIGIKDPRNVISREHILFEHDGHRWRLVDQSLNGTVIQRGDMWHRLMGIRGNEKRAASDFDPPSTRAVSPGDRIVPIDQTYEKQFRFEGPDWTKI